MNDDTVKLSKSGVLIKKKLAEYLGVSPEDIANDDNLKEDLHMSPTERADFIVSLKKDGIEIDTADLTVLESFMDIVEAVAENEDF